MKPTGPPASVRPFNSFMLGFVLSLVLAMAAGRLGAAESTNAAGAVKRTPPPSKLIIPSEWKILLEASDYDFDSLPLSEVTRHLQEQCTRQFDVLIPKDVPAQVDPATGLPESADFGATAISLRLKNVTAIEVFQAMNMLFEIERKPMRWELLMNGNRPVAVLHPLERNPAPSLPPESRPPPISRSVIFVGDLLGGPSAGGTGAGMTPGALVEILEQTVMQALGASTSRKIQYHSGAELLVLSGNDEDMRFMKDVLQALKDKAKHQRERNPGVPQEVLPRK